MVHVLTLRRVGGSIAATIQKEMAERLHLEVEDRVLAVETDRGMLLTPYDPDVEAGLARSHPVSDGHRRTAFLAAMVFLRLNGKALDATETEVVQVISALAEGSLGEVELTTWTRERFVRLTQ